MFRKLFPPAQKYKIVRDKGAGFDASIFNMEKGIIVIEGYWQSFKYFEPFKDIIKSELTFKKQPSQKNALLLKDIENLDSVAVHIRRGDYVTNPKCKDHSTCSIEYYQKAAAYIEQHINKTHFFIFTDDPDWARKNLNFPGPTTVVDHNLE